MNTAATLSAKDRLHDLIKTLQTAAGQSTLPEDRLLVEASRMIVSNAAAALAALYQGTAPEDLAKETPDSMRTKLTLMWHSVLKDSPYEPLAEGLADRSVTLLGARSQVSRPVMQAIAHMEVDSRTTEALTRIVVSHRESADGWNSVMNTQRGQKRTTADTDPAMSRAEPLIAMLGSTQLLASVRAEALAHLEMYIRSGHAAQDLGDGPIDHLKPAEQQSIVKLRALTELMAEGKAIPEATLIAALDGRFEQVFLKTRLSRRADGTNTLKPSATQTTGRFSLRQLPGKGEISILIRDARDPSQILMACGTANRDTIQEGDQIPRFTAAVEHALQAKDYPFSATTTEQQTAIQARAKQERRELTAEETLKIEGGGTLREVWLFAPALFPERSRNAGVTREKLYKMTEKVGSSWSQALLDKARSLQLLRILDSQINGALGKADDWLRANLGTIGGTNAWQPGERATERGQADALYGNAAQDLAELAALGGKIARTGMDKGWKQHHTDAIEAETLLTPLRQAMRGVWRHGQHLPDVVASFGSALNDMDAMKRYMVGAQRKKEAEEWDVLVGAVKTATPAEAASSAGGAATSSRQAEKTFTANQSKGNLTAGENAAAEQPTVRGGAKEPQARLIPGSKDWIAHYRGQKSNEFQTRHEMGRAWILQHESDWKGHAHWNAIKKAVGDMEHACCTEAMRALLDHADPRIYQTTLDGLWKDGQSFRGHPDAVQQTEWARAVAQQHPSWIPKAARTPKPDQKQAQEVERGRSETIEANTPDTAQLAEGADEQSKLRAEPDQKRTDEQQHTGQVTPARTTAPGNNRDRRKKPNPGRCEVSTYRVGQITDLTYKPTGKFKRSVQPLADDIQENLSYAAGLIQKKVEASGHFAPEGVELTTRKRPKP